MLKFVRNVMHVGKWMPFTVVGARISSLLLKRFGKIVGARLHPFEQPHIFDRD